MLTGRDLDLVKFVMDNSCITAKQAHKIFFQYTNQGKLINQGELIARRRLKKLADSKELLVSQDWKTNQKIYYLKKKPSIHTIKCLDFYSELIFQGAEILTFNRELKLHKCTPDAFIAFKVNGKGKMILLEVDLYNRTNPEKYKYLYESQEFQKKYGIFPLITIVSKNKNDKVNTPYKVKYIDLSLGDIKEQLFI
jgi:hypothetical protein